jgi:hypothetical protein
MGSPFFEGFALWVGYGAYLEPRYIKYNFHIRERPYNT